MEEEVALYLFSRLLLVASLALALDNSVTLTERTASTQTDRPFTISRVFAQGDIANYPHPYIAGTAATTWQTDVKTRWPDSSVQHALISFKTTLTASSSVVVDFRSNANPCSSGNQAACDAAALNEAGILAFNSSNWGAVIESAVTGTTLRSASARTCVDDANFTYWLRGPVVTQVICEDATTARVYDFGRTCTASCTGNYASATWADDSTNRSIHPVFVLTMYAGWTGVKVDYIFQNVWSTVLQDQRYDLTLKSGPAAATTEFGPFTLVQYARTSLRKTFWDGSEPGAVKINLNLPYIVYSKVLPSFDTSHVVSASDITAEDGDFDSTSNADTPLMCTVAGLVCSSYYKTFGNTGGHGERGPIPRWFMRYLYTFDDALYANMLQQGDLSGSIPIHYRESRNSGNFYDSTPALGKVISLTARPTFRSSNLSSSSQNAADKITPLATLSGSNNWSVDLAHQSSFVLVPYLATGDWFYLQELYFWAANNVSWTHPTSVTSLGRGEEWGTINDQTRGNGWALRNVAHASFFAPDSSPEKSYFLEKTNNHIAVEEGKFGLTSGRFYTPCSTSPFSAGSETSIWCWANRLLYRGRPNALRHISTGNTGGGCNTGVTDGLDTSTVYGGESPWMQHYNVIVWKWLADMGFLADKLHEAGIGHFIQKTLHPSSNPFILDNYHVPACKITTAVTLTAGVTTTALTFNISSVPSWLTANIAVDVNSSAGGEIVFICAVDGGANTMTACSNGRAFSGTTADAHTTGGTVVQHQFFTSWAEILSGTTGGSTKTSFNTDDDHENGYAHSAFAAMAGAANIITSDGYRGNRAIAWMFGNMKFQQIQGNPKWAIHPRKEISNIRKSGNSLLFTAPDGAACSWANNPTSTLDSGDTAIASGNRSRTIDVTGLSGTIRITCGVARTNFTL